MGNVVQFRLGDEASKKARDHADHIASTAATIMARDRSDEWRDALAVASVLQAMYHGNYWNGSIFGPIDDGKSVFKILAALCFAEMHLDDIADLFAAAVDVPANVIGVIVEKGTPIAERLNRTGGLA
ncbi:hypothetical protein [Phytohalomonas tamaricis]|uniref:hypothetical protein n=1 Tax=Phytohalomonas tamaricis TaxID=2081032 RepID=UPI000D0B94EA|nr:hypothetical protein [Phytohalomonas tamaricis]